VSSKDGIAGFPGGGRYRTVCVRMCDGFYFPISEAAGRSRFKVDAEICSARCPKSEVKLFAHDTGENSETALATDGSGEVYARLQNALAYRSRVVEGCGYGAVDLSLMPAAGLDGAPPAAMPAPAFGAPRPKPEFDEDPDTIANARANFTPVPVEAAGGEAIDMETARQTRTVRIVGPKYLADR
jgi:hypothetical protein